MQGNQCAVCFRPTNTGCSLCQKVYYCSRGHQQKHWDRHKMECEGRIKKFMDSEYNTMGDQTPIPRRNSPDDVDFHQKEILNFGNTAPRSLSKGKEFHVNQRVGKFVEDNEYRKDERLNLAFEYVKGKEESLVMRAKNLVTYSEGIYNQFDISMCKGLHQRYKVRTSKYIQELQYLLDLCFLAKLYLKTGMRQKLKETLYSLKLPDIPSRVAILNHSDPTQLDNYKLWKTETQNCKIVFSLLASISNAGGLSSYTQTVYKNYIHLVERCFGVNQQFIAYFLVGNWYVEIREFNKARCCFEYCIQLKDKEPRQQIIVGDCYFNIALCLRMCNSIQASIDRMHHALIIRRDRIGKNSLEAGECLDFIGKQMVEMGRFNEAIEYMNECYSIRKSLLKPEDPLMLSIIDLIKMVYMIIKQKQKKEADRMNVRQADSLQRDVDKAVKQFNFGDNSQHFFEEFGYESASKKLGEVKLDPTWVQELGIQELQSLTNIITKSDSMPYDDAVMYILQSAFYKSLSEEKKGRFKELNPDFRFN